MAYVYVSNTPSSGAANQITAYAASSTGALTPIAGSPFQDDVSNLAVNGQYLFGNDTAGQNVDTYTIEANGALTAATTTNVISGNDSGCGSTGAMFLDRTGQSLYNMEYNSSTCANNAYQAYTVNASTGALSYVGDGGGDAWLYEPASFLGNNQFAYVANQDGYYWDFKGYERTSTGLLQAIPNFGAPIPAMADGDSGYAANFAVTDNSDHVAVSLTPLMTTGNNVLATYTADSSGNLSTTSTAANMPATVVTGVEYMAADPTGTLLAVAGEGGIQVFHFNGANPITTYTPALTTDTIQQCFWDNSGHLYAISATKLYVFTVSSTTYSQAPGSPYSIAGAVNLAVQPETAAPTTASASDKASWGGRF